MHRFYGLVLFVAGGGFLLVGAHLLYTGSVEGLIDWQKMLLPAGGCVFGYLLTIAGYRMSAGDRF